MPRTAPVRGIARPWATPAPAASDTAALTTALMDCAGTTVLNLDDEGVRAADRLHRVLGSAALSGAMVDGDLLLTMLTDGRSRNGASRGSVPGWSQDRPRDGACAGVSRPTVSS